MTATIQPPARRPTTPISRRRFLKTGCITVAAGGLALCGIRAAMPTPAPIERVSHTCGGNTMNDSVLIAYATATGSAIDVATTISERLCAGSLSAHVEPISDELHLNDTSAYRAVLIGSAVQNGAWLPEAIEFVRTNQEALARLPVALFSVHIRNLGNDEESRRNRRAYLDEVRTLVQPVDEGYFAGRVNRQTYDIMIPGFFARVLPPLDFRNFKKVRTWADHVATLLS